MLRIAPILLRRVNSPEAHHSLRPGVLEFPSVADIHALVTLLRTGYHAMTMHLPAPDTHETIAP